MSRSGLAWVPLLEPRESSPKYLHHKMSTVIGTHSGAFQADEALGVWLLRRLDRFGGLAATVVRSRDMKVLEGLPIVIDVGGIYSHDALRYDHHQRGFFETFDGTVGVATGPETATGKFKTKLSASGLVYKHYGREILCVLHPSLQESPDKLDWVWDKMYIEFMEAIDGNDNGIEIADEMRYKDATSLPNRVHRLNSRWNEPEGGPTEDERFEKASTLCGEEFAATLDYIVNCELPARDVVEAALRSRAVRARDSNPRPSRCGSRQRLHRASSRLLTPASHPGLDTLGPLLRGLGVRILIVQEVDPSGEVIVFTSGGCPWKTHLYELERTHGVEPLVKFVLYEDSSGMWRVQAVTAEGTSYTNRLGLLESWRGLRDAELTAAAGIEGCKFCHATGFIGGNATYAGALAMAMKTIQSS